MYDDAQHNSQYIYWAPSKVFLMDFLSEFSIGKASYEDWSAYFMHILKYQLVKFVLNDINFSYHRIQKFLIHSNANNSIRLFLRLLFISTFKIQNNSPKILSKQIQKKWIIRRIEIETKVKISTKSVAVKVLHLFRLSFRRYERKRRTFTIHKHFFEIKINFQLQPTTFSTHKIFN